MEWFDLLLKAGVPSGPINTVDGGFAMAERFGLDPIVTVGEGDRATPTTRHPIRLSETPADHRLPPPELDEQGRTVKVGWDPTADSSDYEYRYEYSCAAGARGAPRFDDDAATR